MKHVYLGFEYYLKQAKNGQFYFYIVLPNSLTGAYIGPKVNSILEANALCKSQIEKFSK